MPHNSLFLVLWQAHPLDCVVSHYQSYTKVGHRLEWKLLNDFTIALLAHAANTNESVLCCRMADSCVPFLVAFMSSTVAFALATERLTCAVPTILIHHSYRWIYVILPLTYTLSIVTHLPFPLNGCIIRLYRLTPSVDSKYCHVLHQNCHLLHYRTLEHTTWTWLTDPSWHKNM